MKKKIKIVQAIVIAICVLQSMGIQAQMVFWPDATYNPEITSPEEFLGYEAGSYLTDHFQMIDYIHLLKEQAPERVEVIKIGKSMERRDMYLVVISSEENMARLESIRTKVSSLKDPVNTSNEEAREIASNTPVITWMNYANDGDESAAFEAGLQVTYHFAAGTDSETQAVLDESVIVINTAHNPDSHQRHVTWMKASIVGGGTPDRIASEHAGDWRMSNSNSRYQIDMNRDGFALTQDESKIVSENMQYWSPQVWVDYHGEPEEYFFAPYAIPVNPNYPGTTNKWANVIGENNAKAFDEFGWTYYAREVFDLHYPGYWDSYPAFNGAIGMTYETNGGGDKGLVYRKLDGTLSTLKKAIHHHVVASIATAITTAQNREKMLLDYYSFFKSGMDEVKSETVKQIALVPGSQENDVHDLVRLLLDHEIKVYKTGEQKTAQGINYLSGRNERITLPAGTFVVPMAQPNKRLAKVLLERNTDIQPEFLEEALKAYDYNKSVGENAPKQSLGFYDVTAWSLPLTYNINTAGLTREISGLVEISGTPEREGGVVGSKKANYAYYFDYQSNDAARLLSRLIQEEFNVSISTKQVSLNGKDYKRGVVIARVQRNPANLYDRINALATEIGIRVETTDAAWTEKGILLGSRNVVSLHKPKVMVLMEEPVSENGFGAIWFNLEERYKLDFTAVRFEDFNRANLYDFDVIILPPGSSSGYLNGLGEQGISSLKNWISNGGTFIGIKEGAVFAANEKVNLTSSRLLGSQEDTSVDFTPGAILKANLDLNHFLTLGFEDELPVHVFSSNIFTPSEKGANVAVYDTESPKMSGFIFEENEQNFSGNPYLIHEPMGRGNVILFPEEPTFRLYWRGPERLLINSIILPNSF
ncbi:M14 family zinc carboxypeptidase [Gracilimonas sp.]|uniref:M14 family zinc carboxypeptidase n=1 Tax=Gracilimonas sp. TaxID=1974203 RepID=UPI0032EBE637